MNKNSRINSDSSFSYKVKPHSIMDGIIWCYDNNINGWKYVGDGTIAFKDEKEALMFSLRWEGNV